MPSKKLRGDVSTRWGSTAFMVVTIKEQLGAIRIVLSNDRKATRLVPTWQDCDVLDAIIAVVQPLAELTDLLSGEKRVTSSAIKRLVTHITSGILIGKEGDTTLVQQIKSRIRQDLESCYEEPALSDFLEVCSFLDPRFKGTFSSESDSDMTQKVMGQLIGIAEPAEVGSSSQTSEQPPSKKGSLVKFLVTPSRKQWIV